jgi:hypothetical protein
MQGTEGNGFQNEEIEGTRKNLSLFGHGSS